MKRLSKVCTGMSSQKVKFASLYEEDDAEEVGEDEEEALAEKHRKIWRISSIKNGVNNQHQQQHKQEKFVCSKCGKAFQSLKAKCGHMACHSEKAATASNNLVTKQKLVMDDSQSDTESGLKRLTRKSRRKRYKKHNSVAIVGSIAKMDAYKESSSDDSGVEHEQEETAVTLMMLSRDLTNWGGVNSIGNSSDNNSVALKARSISTKLAAQNYGLSSGHRVNKTLKKYAGKKVAALGDLESAFVPKVTNSKNVEMDEKVLRNHRRNKNKFDEGLKTEPHLSLKKLKRVMDAGLIRDREGYNNNQTVRPNMDLYLKKNVLNEPYFTGYNAGNQYSISETYERFRHKACIHSQSYQALSARAEDHMNLAVESSYESGESSFETDGSLNKNKGKGLLEDSLSNVVDKSKKGKHECPVCFKVFKSGQALGCHRRAHLAEGYDEIKSDEFTANFKRSGTQSNDFIDLNLPAPLKDDEASESMASYL